MSSSSTWTAVPGSIVGWSVTQISWLAIRIGRDELMDHWPWKGDRMNCEAILSPPAVWEIYFAAMILSTKKSIVHIPDRQHVVELLFKHFHELNKYDNICEWMCWILRFTFAFCVFWSDVESFEHVPGCASQPIPLCQVLAIQEVNDDPWTCISHFEYTCNPIPTQSAENEQRACTWNWNRLRQLVWWKHCCALCFCWGVWQILCATSKGCHLPRDQQRQHSGVNVMSHYVTVCHTVRFADAVMCQYVHVMSFRFWRWRMAVSFRWATLWPRSPWRCHGPQTSCKAFLALTDSLRPTKRKELLQKRKTQKDNQKKERKQNFERNLVLLFLDWKMMKNAKWNSGLE